MNSKLKLTALAFTPFIIGNIISFIPFSPVLSMIICLIFLGFWFWVGYISNRLVNSTINSILIGNSFGILSILVLVVFGLILKNYPVGIIGIQPQMYFLSAIKLPAVLLPFFMKNLSGTILFATTFVLMAIIYYAGYLIGKKSRFA